MKSRNLFIGILVLFAGVVALLSALGVFDFHWSIFWHLWPIMLIIAGIALLPFNDYLKSALLVLALALGCTFYYIENQHYEGNPITRFFDRHFSSWSIDDEDEEGEYDDEDLLDQRFSEPYAEVEKASIDIKFGAGDLDLKRPCAELTTVAARSHFVRYSFRAEQGENEAAFYLHGDSQVRRIGRNNTNEIDVALSDMPEWSFNLDMGAAEADLDFSPYKMENITINGGACDIDLKLGDNGCNTDIDIETGASDIDIRIPKSLDCQINIESAITGKDFKGFEKIDRGLWQTPGYGEGAHRVVIHLSCAVSDISVERY